MLDTIPAPLPPDALARAREAVIRSQNPSRSARQCQLQLGFADATGRAGQLRRDGVLPGPWPGRAPGLHPGDEDRRPLDHGIHHPKQRMPGDWVGAAHCVYARLHAGGIAFTPAAGHPRSCGGPVPN